MNVDKRVLCDMKALRDNMEFTVNSMLSRSAINYPRILKLIGGQALTRLNIGAVHVGLLLYQSS